MKSYYLNGHEISTYALIVLVHSLLENENSDTIKFVLNQLKQYGKVTIKQHTIEKK